MIDRYHHVSNFSLSPHYLIPLSRVIQKALDELSNRDIANLIATFHGKAILCLNDHNGTIIWIGCVADIPRKSD